MARIVVVDDSPAMRMLVKRVLEEDGHEVIGVFPNGVELLRFLKEQKPDLLLSDMMMPQMDGLEILKAARLLYPDLPVIFLSSIRSGERVRAAKEGGASHYLLKPFENEKLVEVVRKVLGG